MNRLLAFLLLLAASGCALTYTDIGGPLPDVSGLEVDRTTRREVLAALGPPRLIRRQFDGELYTWQRTRIHRRSLTILPVLVKVFFYSDGEGYTDDVSLLFDSEGVLRAVGQRIESEGEE